MPLPVVTKITFAHRPTWYQNTPWALDSPELTERLNKQAAHWLRRFRWATSVTMTAVDLETGRQRNVTHSWAPTFCPWCNHEL